MDEVRSIRWRCDVLPDVVHLGAEAARPTPCVLPQHITLQLQLIHLCIVQDIRSGTHVELSPVKRLPCTLLMLCVSIGLCEMALCWVRAGSSSLAPPPPPSSLMPSVAVSRRSHPHLPPPPHLSPSAGRRFGQEATSSTSIGSHVSLQQ